MFPSKLLSCLVSAVLVAGSLPAAAEVYLDADWENGKFSSGLSPAPNRSFQLNSGGLTSSNNSNHKAFPTNKSWALGSHSLKLSAKPAANRCEVGFMGKPYRFNNGDTRWYGFQLRIDGSWKTYGGKFSTIVAQWKQFSNGPSAKLRIADDGTRRLYFEDRDRNRTTLTTLPTDKWTLVQVKHTWSTGPGGRSEVYVNGSRLFTAYGSNLYDANKQGYMKIGMYTQINANRSIYFDEVKIGDSAGETD